jgi:hypothetical protein
MAEEHRGRQEGKTPENMSSGPLKLRAVDAEDVAVLAACLQDALVPASDMRYLAAENRFILVANRFCWEKLPATALDPDAGADAKGPFERVHCGLTFEYVTRVQARGFDPAADDAAERLFEVLTIIAETNPDGGAALTLLFAGRVAIRLDAARVEILAQDVGEPWPTLWRPAHPLDTSEG